MYHTIRLSSCVSVQGTFVEDLSNGEIVISDGCKHWRGRPINRMEQETPCARHSAKYPNQQA